MFWVPVAAVVIFLSVMTYIVWDISRHDSPSPQSPEADDSRLP